MDDDQGTREFVDYVLRRAGYGVVVASNGPGALALAETHGPFDLVLTDEMMPDMPGHELARRLRRQAPESKILYLTAYVDRLFEESHEMMWEAEAFVAKPITDESLLEAVSLALTGHINPSSTDEAK